MGSQTHPAKADHQLAPVLIALLVGASLLAGLVAALIDPVGFHFTSPEEAGKTFYGWIVGVELLVLVVGGFYGKARRSTGRTWPRSEPIRHTGGFLSRGYGTSAVPATPIRRVSPSVHQSILRNRRT